MFQTGLPYLLTNLTLYYKKNGLGGGSTRQWLGKPIISNRPGWQKQNQVPKFVGLLNFKTEAKKSLK